MVLNNDVKDMGMEVQRYNSVLIGSRNLNHIKILDAKIRGLIYENSKIPRFDP